MKKAAFIFLTGVLTSNGLLGQTDSAKGKHHLGSFGISVPVGEFSKTHVVGLSLQYSWSQGRFGHLRSKPQNLIGFTANAGIAYYLGKNEVVADYEYKYGGYTYFHVFGGIIWNAGTKGHLNLSTGPSMGLYKGVADIGLGAKLEGSYFIAERIALSPAIMYMKHDQTNALWTAMLRAAISF